MYFVFTRVVGTVHKTNSTVFISLPDNAHTLSTLSLWLTDEWGGPERKRRYRSFLLFPALLLFSLGVVGDTGK